MQGNMWVESELGKGSKFFFTVTSQMSSAHNDQILTKMQPYAQRSILFVDTSHDITGVSDRILELGLIPHTVHDVGELSEKSALPHIDTILVDSLPVTELLREIEHLRYIPVVLLSPSFPRLNRAFPSSPPPLSSSFADERFWCTIVKWCLDNSISSHITTPVSLVDMAAALVSALEANSVNPPVTNIDKTFDILLAEDNLVNQRLAVRILEKYGHIVEIAENGSVALNKFKDRVQRGKTSFDVILVRVSPALLRSVCANCFLDGRFDAVHGWDGGYRVDSSL